MYGRPRKYAQGTQVPVDKSRLEIERFVRTRGADEFGSAYTFERATIYFRMKGLRVQFILPLAAPVRNKMTQVEPPEERRRWRALLMIIKAKLAAVDAGIVEFEQEFLPHLIRADGRTVYEDIRSTGLGLYLDDQAKLLPPGLGGG